MYRRQNFIQRNKSYVDSSSIHLLGQAVCFQITYVSALHVYYALIVAQLPRQLTVAYVNRIHLRSTVLQRAVGKTTGRSTDIGNNLAIYADGENLQSLLQLQTAAAYIGQLIAQQTDSNLRCYRCTRFIYFLFIDQYLSCHNRSLSLGTAFKHTAVN